MLSLLVSWNQVPTNKKKTGKILNYKSIKSSAFKYETMAKDMSKNIMSEFGMQNNLPNWAIKVWTAIKIY